MSGSVIQLSKLKSVDLCDEKFEMFTHFGVDLRKCRLTTVDLRD